MAKKKRKPSKKSKTTKKSKPGSSKKSPSGKKRGRPRKESISKFEEPDYSKGGIDDTPTVQPDVSANESVETEVATPVAGVIRNAEKTVQEPSDEMKSVAASLHNIIASHRVPMRREEVGEFLAKNSMVTRAVATFTATGYSVNITNGQSSIRIPNEGEYLYAK